MHLHLVVLRECLVLVAMRFFCKKGMVMGRLKHCNAAKSLNDRQCELRECLVPMKSALSE